jgi:hypothetical protein
MAPTSTQLLKFLIPGYLLTIAIEAPILFLLLSRRHALRKRFSAGLLLTAFTYPIVVLVLPPLLWSRFGYPVYITVAEIFAPLAECAVFYLYWIAPMEQGIPDSRRTLSLFQDFAAIIGANLASWLGGGYLIARFVQGAA